MLERSTNVASVVTQEKAAPTSEQRVLVDCEGNPITVSDKDYTRFCAISNTRHYLRDLGEYALDAICALGRPARVSIVIPSYGSSERLATTLFSLLDQEFVESTEILVLINEPPDVPAAIHAMNDANEKRLRGIIDDDSSVADTLVGAWQDLRAGLAHLDDRVCVHVIRDIVEGGIPAVYQTVLSSFVERARAFSHSVSDERDVQLEEFDDIYDRTLLLFCDDDITICDRDALRRAYRDVLTNGCIVLGHWRGLAPPDTDDPAARIAMRLMEYFLAVKYDLGVNALPPKGLLLRHAFEAGGLTLTTGFGDQLYFAGLAAKRRNHLMEVTTSIDEADYASNGRMMRDLRLYLAGADNSALHIFNNLTRLIAERTSGGRYTIADIEELVAVAESRDLMRIGRHLDDAEADSGKGRLS